MALALAAACSPQPPVPTASPHTDAPAAQQILSEVNRIRLDRSLPALTLDGRLSRAAQAHSDDMAVNDFAGHTGSDGSTGPDRARAAGYDAHLLAENLQMGLAAPHDAVAAWMASPSHRDNLLRPRLVHLGVGYTFVPQDGGRARYGHYWTLLMAAPRQ